MNQLVKCIFVTKLQTRSAQDQLYWKRCKLRWDNVSRADAL